MSRPVSDIRDNPLKGTLVGVGCGLLALLFAGVALVLMFLIGLGGGGDRADSTALGLIVLSAIASLLLSLGGLVGAGMIAARVGGRSAGLVAALVLFSFGWFALLVRVGFGPGLQISLYLSPLPVAMVTGALLGGRKGVT